MSQTSKITEFNGIFTKVASYFPNDGSDLVHFHERLHLSFVIQGGGIVKSRTLNCERLPSNLIFFHAGDPHQCLVKEYPSKNINLEVGYEFLNSNDLTETALGMSIRKNPNAKMLMLKIYKEILSNDDFTSSSIRMLILDLICNENLSVNNQPIWVSQIYDLMNDSWSEPLSLEDLAQTVEVHPVTISKYFRKYFGCTFGEYMRRIRIEKSLSMIKNSDFSLTEIGYECGFYDQSHFSRTFRQLTGFSPKMYSKF